MLRRHCSHAARFNLRRTRGVALMRVRDVDHATKQELLLFARLSPPAAGHDRQAARRYVCVLHISTRHSQSASQPPPPLSILPSPALFSDASRETHTQPLEEKWGTEGSRPQACQRQQGPAIAKASAEAEMRPIHSGHLNWSSEQWAGGRWREQLSFGF